MKIHLVMSFVLAGLASAHLYAQDFVVTTKGDTLRGEVKPVSFGANSTIKLIDANKKKTSYTLFQVRSFFHKNETYRPIKGPNGYTFMKLVKDGYLSLYAFQLPNQIAFDGSYLMKRDGSGLEVPNLTFKKMMANFLIECTSVSEKIDKGELTKRNLTAIIDEYNGCVANKTIDYSKQISKQEAQTKKISSWDVLEEKVKAHADFEGKASALEMITEIKSKISKEEKVPNFLTEGLKNILNPTELKGDLESALKELE